MVEDVIYSRLNQGVFPISHKRKKFMVRVTALTDVGMKRNMNQDFVFASAQAIGPLPNICIVADGMGGHAAGDEASKLAAETVLNQLQNNATGADPEEILRNAVMAANTAVWERAHSDLLLYGMGSTLCAATVIGDMLYAANVGDSRIYTVFHEITQITIDHSLVEEYVQQGNITREQARIHPDRNIITRAIGADAGIAVDTFAVRINDKTKILLCSDGLYGMLEDGRIREIVSEPVDIIKIAGKLIWEANVQGGMDNIAVALMEVKA